VTGCGSSRSGLELQDDLVGRLPQDESLPAEPHDEPYSCTLTAAANGWKLTVRWDPGDLVRQVTFDSDEVRTTMRIPLRNRPRPWTSSDAGVTSTRYGPYQPACNHREGEKVWHVTMEHEQLNFPTVADLTAQLSWPWYSDPSWTAVSADGTVVRVQYDAHPTTPSLNIDVLRLTVNGAPPTASVMEPFLKGEITIEPRSETQSPE
jgi:hypothetical protein